MKMLKILSVTIFIFTAMTANAQDAEISRTISTENYSKLVLKSSGEVEIESVKGDQIKVQSKLYKDGKIWGLQFPSSRPEFKIKTHKDNKKLNLILPEKFKPGIVGVTTYSEEIVSKIRIPENLNVKIKGGEIVKLYGNFKSLVTEKVKKLAVYELSKNKISRMSCQAEEKLIVNDKIKPNAYEMESTGKNLYKLNAKEIKVSFK